MAGGFLPPVSRQMRALTAAFVDRAPVDVEFEGVAEVPDGEGGTTVARLPARQAQRVTLCEPGSSGYGPPASSTDGTRRLADLLLVGAWDVDVRRRDEFELDGVRYRVDEVLPSNGWEARAYVVRVGAAS